MTSCELSTTGLSHSVSDKDSMREFRRPTLCVIDENGTEVSQTTFPDVDCPNDNDISFSFNKLTARDHNANVTKVEHHDTLNPPNNDLTELKATTARLKLSTRRKSTVAWQTEHLNSSNIPVKPKFSSKLSDPTDDGFTEERITRINEALAWLRTELLAMRSQDESLARTLLSLRHDIHQLKLQRSCEEHRDMLDDIAMDMEETHQLNEICDMPMMDSVSDTPLKHLGVTRMNLSARRFSTC